MNPATPEETTLNELRQLLAVDCLISSTAVRSRRVFVEVKRDCMKNALSELIGMGFTHLSTVTGLELDDKVELIYHLIKEGAHLGLRVALPLDNLVVPTITDLIPGASLYEREVHDMLGVLFDGHPNLTRFILPDKWDERYPPLRKQAPAGNIPMDVTPRKRRPVAPRRTNGRARRTTESRR